MKEEPAQPSIDELLDERIAAGDFPSAVYLVSEKGEISFQAAHGLAVRAPVHHAATIETIYDLASLTKPLITGLLCALLLERGEINLSDRVAYFLPEFSPDNLREITLQQLLTHTSGLAAWRSLNVLTGDDPTQVLSAIAALPLAAAPGSQVIYSDLGFITLGLLLEKLSGISLDLLARREIFAPLKLSTACFNPAPAWRERIAASETGNAYEREMHGQSGSPSMNNFWREHLIWGEVHDGNAHFLGGVAGHAGLFATAFDADQIARQFLAQTSQLLRPETCDSLTTNLTPGLNEARSLSWQLAATENSTAGPDLPLQSFGHTGFTGTSCWIDPERERILILLTNRTHDHPPPFVNINGVRRRFHSLAVAALDQHL